MINPKFSISGLGHPTKWYVPLQNDFTTKEEAEAFQEFLQGCVEMAERLDEMIERYKNLIKLPQLDTDKNNLSLTSAWVGTLDCLEHVKHGDNY